jgi:hypothetical protein
MATSAMGLIVTTSLKDSFGGKPKNFSLLGKSTPSSVACRRAGEHEIGSIKDSRRSSRMNESPESGNENTAAHWGPSPQRRTHAANHPAWVTTMASKSRAA